MSLPALLNSQNVLGDSSQFTARILSSSKPAAIDLYLSLSPGTTIYGNSGPLVGVSGVIVSTSHALVVAAMSNLTALAGNVVSFALPPGVLMVGEVTGFQGCYFGATDIVTGSVSGSGSAWSQSYSVVLRVLNTSPADYVAPSTATSTIAGILSLQTGLTATGTNQATALLLTNNSQNEFTTVVSGAGAILPIAVLPAQITITNDGANALNVYPAPGGTITNGTANAAVSLASGSSISYYASSGTNWYPVVTLTGVGSGTVTSVATGTLLTGGPIMSTGTVAMATGTANSLIGYSGAGTASGVTVSTGLTLSGGVLTAAGGAPGGSTGQIQYDNAGSFGGTANLVVSATGTPNTPSIADPSTPIAGDFWLSSATNSPVDVRGVDGSSNRFIVRRDGTFFQCGNCTAVSNFTTMASLLGSPANSVGSLVVPAGFFQIGQIIEISFIGIYSCTASSPTFVIGVSGFGPNINTGVQIVNTTSASGLVFGTLNGPILLAVTTNGASGFVAGGGSVQYTMLSSRTPTSLGMTAVAQVPVAFNTTVANTIVLSGTCGTASASNSLQILSFQARIRG